MKSLMTQALILMFFGLPSTVAAQSQEALLTVSIDYEGDLIQEHNIEAIKEFQKQFPHIRLVHFLNAASFTVEGADPEHTAKLLKSLIRPGFDELGLHIHPRKSLVRASQVSFREVPTYLGDADPDYIRLVQNKNLMPWQEPRAQTAASQGTFGEAGDDVPFWAYMEAEQRKIIRTSLRILKAHGFSGIRSFRAGGWSASPETWKALTAEGIFIDSSAVPPEIISKLYGKSYLMHFNQQIWKGIHKASQPYKIDLESAEIWQFPNNGGLADYQSPEDFLNSFITTLDGHPQMQKVVLHIGFHLESAAKYIKNVADGIRLIEDHARQRRVKLTPAIFKDSLSTHALSSRERNRSSTVLCRRLLAR